MNVIKSTRIKCKTRAEFFNTYFNLADQACVKNFADDPSHYASHLIIRNESGNFYVKPSERYLEISITNEEDDESTASALMNR